MKQSKLLRWQRAPVKYAEYGTVVPVFRVGEDVPAFDLLLYGVGKEFYYVPTGPRAPGSRPIGGEFVTEALRRRGLDPDMYWTSFWFAEEMRR